MITSIIVAKSVVMANDTEKPDLQAYEYTCFYNLSGEILHTVKAYIRLTSPGKMAYLDEQGEIPKVISTDLTVKRAANCSSGICEGLILLGFDDKFTFQKNTTIDGVQYFQIKTSHREKYVCFKGIE
jgi:hypothetical protein